MIEAPPEADLCQQASEIIAVMSECGRSSRLLRYMRGVASSALASITEVTSSPCAFCDNALPKCVPTLQAQAVNCSSDRPWNGRLRSTTRHLPLRHSPSMHTSL